jgi:putative tricarboxylic transport membrane protein
MMSIVTVSRAVPFALAVVLSVIGACALNNKMANIYVLAASGPAGCAMVESGFPLGPFILGAILADEIESNLVRAIMSDPDPWLCLSRPISGTLLALSIASIVAALWQHWRQQKRLGVVSQEDAADF